MILTISCAKDYNALFNERIAELNKEGKYILNQYNDSVGKEHYIVYIDADKIVVDTLGDSLQVYPLGKWKHISIFLMWILMMVSSVWNVIIVQIVL